MYKFVDTNQATRSTPLPSEALNFNGQFLEKVIPGYQTLSVSGRELVPSEIESYQLGIRDGKRLCANSRTRINSQISPFSCE